MSETTQPPRLIFYFEEFYEAFQNSSIENICYINYDDLTNGLKYHLNTNGEYAGIKSIDRTTIFQNFIDEEVIIDKLLNKYQFTDDELKNQIGLQKKLYKLVNEFGVIFINDALLQYFLKAYKASESLDFDPKDLEKLIEELKLNKNRNEFTLDHLDQYKPIIRNPVFPSLTN